MAHRQTRKQRAASLRNLRKARAARKNPSRKRKTSTMRTKLTGLRSGDRVVVYRAGRSIIQHNVGGARARGNPSRRRKTRRRRSRR